MSTLTVTNIRSYAANTPPFIADSAGTEVGEFCRAWVNFNGTGTVAIRASFNVSSITDNGNGLYRVVFTNTMPDANYSLQVSLQNPGSTGAMGWGLRSGFDPSTSGVDIAYYQSGVATDREYMFVAAFR